MTPKTIPWKSHAEINLILTCDDQLWFYSAIKVLHFIVRGWVYSFASKKLGLNLKDFLSKFSKREWWFYFMLRTSVVKYSWVGNCKHLYFWEYLSSEKEFENNPEKKAYDKRRMRLFEREIAREVRKKLEDSKKENKKNEQSFLLKR